MRNLLLAGLLAAAATSVQAQDETPVRQITVIGEGRVETPPDMAVITAGIETTAATAQEALSANSDAMTAIFAVLEEAGVDRADMQTSQLNVQPIWTEQRGGSEQGPEIAGYAASNLLSVRLRDLARLGATLDALSVAGANRIDGVQFSLAEPGAIEDEARREAIADARAKAELLAGAAGVTVGPIVTIREAGPPAGPMAMRAEAAMMDVPIAEGRLGVTAQVEVVYAIIE
jgi:uncharacterized protein